MIWSEIFLTAGFWIIGVIIMAWVLLTLRNGRD